MVDRLFIRADQLEEAHRVALDWIVGPLSLSGLYQQVLEDWLPDIVKSSQKKTRAEALGQTGKQFVHLGEYEKALDYLEQSLAIRQDIGDKSGEGATLNNISQIYKARGDYQTALSYLEKSLAIRQEIGDVAGMCATKFNMGHIQLQKGQLEKAMATWAEVYDIAIEIDLAQALGALEGLAAQLELPGGNESWAKLSKK